MAATEYKLRPRHDVLPKLQDILPKEKAEPKTAADRMKSYRSRLKENPQVYEEYRLLETVRIREYRKRMTDEKKKETAEKHKMYMRNYRNKKKNEPVTDKNTQERIRTRKETKLRTDKWKEQKAEYRKRLTKAQRNAINKRRREKHALQKAHRLLETLSISDPSTTTSDGIKVKLTSDHQMQYPEQTLENSTMASPVSPDPEVPQVPILSTTPSEPEKVRPENPPNSDPPVHNQISGFRSGEAKRKAASRARQSLPKSPYKFADCMAHLIKNSTPTRKAALSQKCITSPSSKRRLEYLEKTSMSSFFKSISKQRSNKMNYMRRLAFHCLKRSQKRASNSALRKMCGFSSRFLRRGGKPQEKRNQRKDALPKEVIEKVVKFYNRGDISREMPSPRLVGKKVLESTITALYAQFKNENPDTKISQAKFFRLRPSNVLTHDQTQLMQCLCEYCVNIDFKLKSLCQKLSTDGYKDIADSLPHKYQLSYATLCARSEGETYHRKVCIDRKCTDCGVEKLHKLLAPFEDSKGESEIKWKVWTNEAYKRKGKDGIEAEAKHMVLKERVTTVNEFLSELLKDIDPFSKHLFNAKWQTQQFEHLKAHLPPSCVMLCMDFGENYNCHYQDEAQSAHWSYNQATLHPIVAYYNCPEPDCKEVIHESIVFVSDDKKHDQHAVQHFVSQANRHLMSKGIKINHQVHFSDGSPTQYKSKVNFCDASFGKDDFGFSVEKNFFGSRHGKGPCDGEIGVVKKTALAAVKTRQKIISNANELFEFGQNALTLPKPHGLQHTHSRRTFIFVKAGDIVRNRKERTGCNVVPNTRSIHSVRGIARHIVQTRTLSCFCQACVSPAEEMSSTCPNLEYTGKCLEFSLKTFPVSSVLKRRQVKQTNKPVSAGETSQDVQGEQTLQASIQSSENTFHEPTTNLTDVAEMQENEKQSLNTNSANSDHSSESDSKQSAEPVNKYRVEDQYLKKMHFYAVYYSKPSKFYIGRLETDSSQEDMLFNYLRRTPARNNFYWPKQTETEIEDKDYIFHGPIQLKGQVRFTLEEDELAIINAKFQELKKMGLR